MNQDARVTAPTRVLRVALLGCGTVGRQVAGTLLDKAEDLAAKAGCHLELIGIAVRNVNKPREGIPPSCSPMMRPAWWPTVAPTS